MYDIVCWRWKATKKSNSAAFVCIVLSIYPRWLSDGVTPDIEDAEKLNNNNGELGNSTNARNKDPNYTAGQPTVALKEYADILY